MNHFRAEPIPYVDLLADVWSVELRRQFEQLLCNPWSLLICKVVIGLVSAYDIYLTVKYVESLPYMEWNPIGRWLMHLDNGPNCHLQQTACFITAKFSGNFIALSVIELLASWRRPMASAVAIAVAICQLGLLYFLVFGER